MKARADHHLVCFGDYDLDVVMEVREGGEYPMPPSKVEELR